MAQRGVLPHPLLAWPQTNASPNAVMSSSSPAWGHCGVTHPSIHSAGCEGSPQRGLDNANFAWAHGGVQASLMHGGGSGSGPRVDVNTMSSSDRKKFLIKYLMRHVNHDDLLTGALLVLCNKGIPESQAEERARIDDDARAAQEALFRHTDNARASAITDDAAMPVSAAPPPPPPMVAPSLAEVLNMQEQQAWLNAVMEENMALSQKLMAASQSSVQLQPPSEMWLPRRHSLPELLSQTAQEPFPHFGSGTGNSAYEAHQMYADGSAYSGQHWLGGMGPTL